MTIRKQLADKDIVALSALLSTHPEIIETLKDPQLIKDIISSTHNLIAAGVSSTVKVGGWEQLISGSDTNTDVMNLLTNPSVILYSQVLAALVIAAVRVEPDLVQRQPISG